ncbi:MAG: Rpn family recombination-promoting nuclease/putative transposase [Chlamydiota bacterium]
MQNKKVPEVLKRTQYYTAHNYVSQARKGADYLELRPVILLATLNHEVFPDKEQYISYHRTLDVDTYESDLEDLSYVFIELPKFTKKEDELTTIQDKWIYFFKNWSKAREVPSQVNEPELVEAYKTMEEYNWSREELNAYVKANLAFTEEKEARRIEREEGREEGRKEGRKEGREEGREEGRKEGREEEKVALVRKLLKRSRPVKEISEDTGLSIKKIQALAQKKTAKLEVL